MNNDSFGGERLGVSLKYRELEGTRALDWGKKDQTKETWSY